MDEVLWRACIQLATGGVQEKLFSFQFTVTHSLHVEEQVISSQEICVMSLKIGWTFSLHTIAAQRWRGRRGWKFLWRNTIFPEQHVFTWCRKYDSLVYRRGVLFTYIYRTWYREYESGGSGKGEESHQSTNQTPNFILSFELLEDTLFPLMLLFPR